MAGKPKASKEEMRQAILEGMSYERIAARFGYKTRHSAYGAVWQYGLTELYKQVKAKREERKRNRLAELVEAEEKREEESLFATCNGKVVVNNLHLVLGHVEPYLPGKFGKVV